MNWGDFVREKRLSAGYGLRQFASLVGILPSNYNNMEKGRMSPPQGNDRLDQIADVLGMEAGSEDYHMLMDLAVAGKDKLPADVEKYAKENELVPILLRTLENQKLSEEELRELFRQLNEDVTRPRKVAEESASTRDS